MPETPSIAEALAYYRGKIEHAQKALSEQPDNAEVQSVGKAVIAEWQMHVSHLEALEKLTEERNDV